MSAAIYGFSLLSVLPILTVDPEALISGPRVGKPIPGAFNALVAFCPGRPQREGRKACLVEWYEDRSASVVMIFARQLDDPFATLIQKLDAEIDEAKAKGENKHAFAVMLSDDKEMEKKLKTFGEQSGLQNISLAIGHSAGPIKYKIAPEAEVTVIRYTGFKVIENHAFKKGRLTEKYTDSIVSSLRSR